MLPSSLPLGTSVCLTARVNLNPLEPLLTQPKQLRPRKAYSGASVRKPSHRADDNYYRNGANVVHCLGRRRLGLLPPRQRARCHSEDRVASAETALLLLQCFQQHRRASLRDTDDWSRRNATTWIRYTVSRRRCTCRCFHEKHISVKPWHYVTDVDFFFSFFFFRIFLCCCYCAGFLAHVPDTTCAIRVEASTSQTPVDDPNFAIPSPNYFGNPGWVQDKEVNGLSSVLLQIWLTFKHAQMIYLSLQHIYTSIDTAPPVILRNSIDVSFAVKNALSYLDRCLTDARLWHRRAVVCLVHILINKSLSEPSIPCDILKTCTLYLCIIVSNGHWRDAVIDSPTNLIVRRMTARTSLRIVANPSDVWGLVYFS